MNQTNSISTEKGKAPNQKSFGVKSSAQEVATGFDEFMKAFESFKEANDERLDQLENQKSISTAASSSNVEVAAGIA